MNKKCTGRRRVLGRRGVGRAPQPGAEPTEIIIIIIIIMNK